MTKWLYDSYSTIPESFKDDFFYSTKNEAELTKIRANYVNKSALAHCVYILDLDDSVAILLSAEYLCTFRTTGIGEGNSETSAKMNVAKKALDFLHKYQIEQIAGKATPDTAV